MSIECYLKTCPHHPEDEPICPLRKCKLSPSERQSHKRLRTAEDAGLGTKSVEWLGQTIDRKAIDVSDAPEVIRSASSQSCSADWGFGVSLPGGWVEITKDNSTLFVARLESVKAALKPRKPKRYNHVFTVAFSVVSNEGDASDVTVKQLRSALQDRIDAIEEADMWEDACGAPELSETTEE